jgi:hypothetical protein
MIRTSFFSFSWMCSIFANPAVDRNSFRDIQKYFGFNRV